jgi:Cd2+/Zn2+-exporting ATPase
MPTCAFEVISIPWDFAELEGSTKKWHCVLKANFGHLIANNIQNVVMDKTGTMTEEGVLFKGARSDVQTKFNKETKSYKWLMLWKVKVPAHPVATAIHEFVGEIEASNELKDIERNCRTQLKR